MSKSIAVFIDGTGNSSHDESKAITNVVTLFRATDLPLEDKQYFSGVGALGPPPDIDSAFASAKKRLQALLQISDTAMGGATGLGLSRRIKEAYEFLCERYEPGDSIYLFGFSRGAYAARSLAGFVHLVGLLLKNKLQFVEKAFILYEMGIPGQRTSFRNYLLEVTGRLPMEGEETNEHSLPIYFIGVWDTVASLGLPRAARKLTNPFTSFHMVALPPNVTNARHAIALHEPRREFPPVLWSGPSHGGQSLVQCFFPGAHADIGGGYEDRSHSDVALSWMAREAQRCRLPLRPSIPPIMPTAGRINCELKGWWRLAGSIDRAPIFEACPHPFVAHDSARGFVVWDTDLGRGAQARLRAAEAWRERRVRLNEWPFVS